jgi:hypothetical protein
MMNKCKDTEDKVYMEWLRVNKPDKWRKIQRMKLEREHEKKHKPKEKRNGNTE